MEGPHRITPPRAPGRAPTAHSHFRHLSYPGPLNTALSIFGVAAVAVVSSCGGGTGGGGAAGTGGGGKSGTALVVPVVPAGANEAACQKLCTLGAGETICTAKHVELCLALCRASTRDLPAACADCVLAAGTPIKGDKIGSESYCHVGGAANLSECETECDDGGGQPAPALETLCQLYCSFYTQSPLPFACSVMASKDCLTSCRSTIAAHGRVCAQCVTEQTLPGSSCINDDCDCLNSYDTTQAGCTALCDATKP
jgi:hypothetical protein